MQLTEINAPQVHVLARTVTHETDSHHMVGTLGLLCVGEISTACQNCMENREHADSSWQASRQQGVCMQGTK